MVSPALDSGSRRNVGDRYRKTVRREKIRARSDTAGFCQLTPLSFFTPRHLPARHRGGVFVDDDPGYLARLFSALDQVLLADWVAGGMKAGREELVDRLRAQVERSFVRTGAASTRRCFTARAPSPGSSTPTPRRPPRTPARGTPTSPT